MTKKETNKTLAMEIIRFTLRFTKNSTNGLTKMAITAAYKTGSIISCPMDNMLTK